MSKGRLIKKLEDQVDDYKKLIKKTPAMAEMFYEEIEALEAEIRLIRHKRYDKIMEYERED